MQTVSAQLTAALQSENWQPAILVELYASDALPGADGFDPDTAMLRLSNGLTTWKGETYQRYVLKVGQITRTITERFNTVNITLDNADRAMAAFVLNNDIEGMFLVVRFVSRVFTADALDDSAVQFVGRCEKTYEANNPTVQISAKQYLGSVDEEIPARTFGPEDEQGRDADDPLFEGFPHTPVNIQRQYDERVPRGGLAGAVGLKKTVTRTIQYTSHTDAKEDSVVPLLLGRAQIVLTAISYVDLGTEVYMIMAGPEGPIADWHDLKVLTPGYFPQPSGLHLRYGYDGGTNGQDPIPSPDASNYSGNGRYSRTAWTAFHTTGSEVSEEDPAPDAVAVPLGLIIPIPNADGDFVLEGWTDNPAFHVRWMLTDTRQGFALDPAFINDPECLKTACYCDDPVLDATGGEQIVFPTSLQATYGTWWWRYHSTGLLKPAYFKHYFLDEGLDPPPELRMKTPTFGTAAPAIVPFVRRRFTSNYYLRDRKKKVDALFKDLAPAARIYLVQNSKGTLDIRCKRPADNTLIRSDISAGVTEIPVNSVLAWKQSLSGKILIGVDTLTSEIRIVTGWRYTTAGNGITLAVSGALTASGATFSGGNNSTTPATATVTVTGLGTLTVTIGGHSVSYTTESASVYANGDVADTTASAAAMLAHFMKADPVLKPYVKVTWDKDTPTVISLQSKLGFLQFADALEDDHDAGEEVVRIQAVLDPSTIIRDSASWPVGSRQSSVNRIDGTFIDSPLDFRPQMLRTREAAHIASSGKTLPKEINLTAVDNYSQAKRLQLQELAETRDNDFFFEEAAVGEHLLLEEGDLVATSHPSGDFRHLLTRLEEVRIDPDRMILRMVGRRYQTSAYSDSAPARKVPIPSGLTQAAAGPPNIQFNTEDYDSCLVQTTDGAGGITSVRGGVVFGESIYAQVCKVRLTMRASVAVDELIATLEPDGDNKAHFEFIASAPGVYVVELEVCFKSSNTCSATKPTCSVTVGLGSNQGEFIIPMLAFSGGASAEVEGEGGYTMPMLSMSGTASIQVTAGGGFTMP